MCWLSMPKVTSVKGEGGAEGLKFFNFLIKVHGILWNSQFLTATWVDFQYGLLPKSFKKREKFR
jgi:hypothetical protein